MTVSRSKQGRQSSRTARKPAVVLQPRKHDEQSSPTSEVDHDDVILVEGESPDFSERLIVSTTTGLFDFLDPPRGPAIGDPIAIGQEVATVGATPIVSPFQGELAGVLAIEGERVTAGQPIAWLRSRA